MRVRAPKAALKGRLVLHGSQRTAELIHLTNGHTTDDCVLFIGFHPVLGTGDLVEMGAYITKLKKNYVKSA